MSKIFKTFRFGVHPKGYKEMSAHSAFEVMPVPEKLFFPVSQHIGAESLPVVAVGQDVKVGELLASANGFISANIFSSISGKVMGFEMRENIHGNKIKHIVIENDYKYEEVFLTPLLDPKPNDLISRCKDAGIVGMGGATFPTYVKLSLKDPVHTLIINGAECEPYITADYRLMLEKTEEIFEGINYFKKALKVNEVIIGIEDNKLDAIKVMKRYARYDIKVQPLKTKYPQGAEKQLIYAIANKFVPVGKLPSDIGFVVLNISSAFAMYEAVALGRTSHSRYMTVSGKGIDRSANLYVRTGTPFSAIVDFLGDNHSSVKVISGGPMMGVSQSTLNPVATKGTSALLLLTNEEIRGTEPGTCLNCAKCAKACPMHLMPMMIDAYTMNKDLNNAARYFPINCVECGCCSFVCPAKRPIVQSIKLAKKLIRQREMK